MTQITAASEIASRAVNSQTLPGKATVLLVEDEEMVRRVVSEALRRAGYEVLECCDPAQGLETSRRDGLQIDVLLTDVVLPNMSGPQLAERMQKIQPQMRVVFMSGYPDCKAACTEQLKRSGYLQKPFTLKALADTLAQAVGH